MSKIYCNPWTLGAIQVTDSCVRLETCNRNTGEIKQIEFDPQIFLDLYDLFKNAKFSDIDEYTLVRKGMKDEQKKHN